MITDHKPLTSIFHPAKSLPALSVARLQRYAIFLSSLTYDVVCRKTSDHCNADALSRLPLQYNEQETEPGAVSDPINTLHIAQLSTLPIRAADIRRATASDPVLSRAYFFTQSGWPDHVDDDSLRPYFNRRLELKSHGGVLLWGLRVVIPSKFREAVLSELHTGHQGIVKTKQLARSFVWWPGIDSAIERLICSCQGCAKTQSNPSNAQLHPWKWPSQPWERIHIDFAGPFMDSMWLIIVDVHSKWPEVLRMSSTTSSKLISTLSEVFSRFGLPIELVSDNEPHLTSSEFRTFLCNNGIRHSTSAPYHPATNGLLSCRTICSNFQECNEGHGTSITKGGEACKISHLLSQHEAHCHRYVTGRTDVWQDSTYPT